MELVRKLKDRPQMTPPPPDPEDAMTHRPSKHEISERKKAWAKPTISLVHRIMQTSGGTIPVNPVNWEQPGTVSGYAPLSA